MEPKELDWVESDGKLIKNFSFVSFQEAIEFVNGVAQIAEELDHHPDLFIHDWNQVRISTITHDSQSITNEDIQLIEQIESLYEDEFLSS